MRRTLITVLTLIALLVPLSISFSQPLAITYSVTPSIIYENDTFVLTVNIIAYSNIENVKVALLDLPNSLESNSSCSLCSVYSLIGCKSYYDSCYTKIGDLNANMQRSYSFVIKAKDEGSYVAKIGIKYEYNNEAKEIFQTVPIIVYSKKYGIIEIKSETLDAVRDNYTKIKLIIKNVGDDKVKNVAIYTFSQYLFPLSNYEVIKELDKGESKEVEFEYKVGKLQEGDYPINFVISYLSNNLTTINYTALVHVIDNRKEKFLVTVDEIEPEKVNEGEKIRVRIKIANIGDIDVSNLVVNFTVGNYSKGEFIGDVDKGDFDIASFEIVPAKENLIGIVKLSYEVNDKEKEKIFELPIKIRFNEKMKYNFGIYVLAVFLIIMIILTIMLKKK